MTTPTEVGVADSILSRLPGWVDRGLISADQADAIRADVTQESPDRPAGTPATGAPSGRNPFLGEALGYLGGAIAIVALGLVLGTFWDTIGFPGHVAVTFVAFVGLLVGGFLAPAGRNESASRLRAVNWFGAVIAFFFTMALLLDRLDGVTDTTRALIAGLATTLVAGLLWALHHNVLQHLAAFVAGIGTLLVLVDLFGGDTRAAGFVTWVVGIAWVVGAKLGFVRTESQGLHLGAVAVAIGAGFMLWSDVGNVLALLTIVGLVVLATIENRMGILVIAALATVVIVPVAMNDWFRGMVAPALALLAAGLALVAVAVRMSRRP